MNIKNKPRIAVLSPFVDRHHGTERIIAEWISRLTARFEVHLYSQRVAELDLSEITWHRIPTLPGPHLLNYLWWFGANHVWRWWDRHIRKLRHDLVFSPGINCLDADVISIHVVFAEYCRRERAAASQRQSIRSWPRALHRKLYYQLIMALERRVYINHRNELILTAKKTAQALQHYFGRNETPTIIYAGLDHDVFNARNCSRLRQSSRKQLRLAEDEFCLLLIGNGWKNKGLPILLASLQRLSDLPIRLLVVGKDDPGPYETLAWEYGVRRSVTFLPPRNDVIFYYSTADVVVGPSLEDTFALPITEGMACGIPVITSLATGASELIINGQDGILLSNPEDPEELASSIRWLYGDKNLRHQLGKSGSRAVARLNWDESSLQVANVLKGNLAQRLGPISRHPSERMEITGPRRP